MSVYARSQLSDYMTEHGLTVERMSGADYTVVDGHERYEYVLRLHHAPTQDYIELPWFTGIGITEDPEDRPEEILGILVRDAWSLENCPTFEDWASEWEIDVDSRQEEKTYLAIKAQAEQFVQLIGGRGELENLAMNYEMP